MATGRRRGGDGTVVPVAGATARHVAPAAAAAAGAPAGPRGPLAPAAVHAGLVKPGESAVVKVTVVAPPAQFQGCVRHGVTSHDFGRYGSAYRLSAI